MSWSNSYPQFGSWVLLALKWHTETDSRTRVYLRAAQHNPFYSYCLRCLSHMSTGFSRKLSLSILRGTGYFCHSRLDLRFQHEHCDHFTPVLECTPFYFLDIVWQNLKCRFCSNTEESFSAKSWKQASFVPLPSFLCCPGLPVTLSCLQPPENCILNPHFHSGSELLLAHISLCKFLSKSEEKDVVFGPVTRTPVQDVCCGLTEPGHTPDWQTTKSQPWKQSHGVSLWPLGNLCSCFDLIRRPSEWGQIDAR